MSYAVEAEVARREAQIAQEEADVSEGFRRTELLDRARQLRERAERFERFAAQEEDRPIQFGTLTPDGLTEQRTLPQSAIRACPHVILDPDHYREEDNSCRCDDPDAPMAQWGYTWNGERWV